MNRLFDIETQDIVPSMITILVICVALLYGAIIQTSIYLALILHLLLCFHVLISHAVIVWVAVKDNGERAVNYWRSGYRITQLAGFVVLAASVYFGLVLKKCDLGILGFFGAKSFSIEWFAPLAVLPFIFCAFVTLLLGDYLRLKECLPTHLETPHNHRHCYDVPRSIVHTVLVVVWMLSIIFVIALLESTVQGNGNQICKAPDASEGWTFGQILPLVLNIPPVWLFVKHIFMRFKERIFSKRVTSNHQGNPPTELREVHSNGPNSTVEDTNQPDDQQGEDCLFTN